MMDIYSLHQCIRESTYEISLHAEKERYEEDILIADIESAILTGEIIEHYPEDPRGESCLVLGHDAAGRPIHIVCGWTPGNRLRIITVYLPKKPKWVDERTRRQEA